MTPRRIGLIGHGAIGSVVANRLLAGDVPGAALTCIVAQHPIPCSAVRRVGIEEAIAECDLIVEAAGQQAVREYARPVLDAGDDLLVASVGALADLEIARQLLAPAPGRLYVTSGAIGGLDLLAAARRLGRFDRVTLTTTKRPAALVQPWMDDATRAALLAATEPVEVYRGTAADVPARFPKSTNVAAAVALAVGDWHGVTVIVRADPAATRTSHVIEASAPYGDYRFDIRNTPDESNPRTSKIVPYAVLQAIAKIMSGSASII